ncbi:MAG: glycerophosphodiester phosphodiesterase [Chloroflexaceae bacterium]|jgi:glycerophosphoryl diester phosphodiesterase|nr:glycerophosphodiester phosphodiesterase [Chloroflexaceae bacterium]
MTLVIAHRGASAYAPENTLKAFTLAADQGADMCELDVIATSDGALAVFHDDTTGRWEAHDRDVRQVNMAHMQALDIGGETVPHLAEVLDLARVRGMQLNVELKHAGVARQVLDAIRDARMHEAVIISSFVAQALAEVRACDATIRTAYLMGSDTYHPLVRLREAYPMPALRRYGCQAWHPYYKLPLIDWAITQVLRAGFAVNVWTVNEPADMQHLLALGVTGIITDTPDVLHYTRRSFM